MKKIALLLIGLCALFTVACAKSGEEVVSDSAVADSEEQFTPTRPETEVLLPGNIENESETSTDSLFFRFVRGEELKNIVERTVVLATAPCISVEELRENIKDEDLLEQITLDIANLKPEDIGVELVVAKPMVGNQDANVDYSLGFTQTKVEGKRVTYTLEYNPKKTGIFDMAIRIFPKNEKLAHRMDFALVKWA